MSYWDNLCETRSVSRIQQFNHIEESGISSILIRPSGYFLIEIEGQTSRDGILRLFLATVAPMESAWEVLVDGVEYSRNVGRVGMSWLRADGESYTTSAPYVPRPHYLCPSNLVFYDNLPIWGSTIERYARDFIPDRVSMGNERYSRILFRPDERRQNEGSRAEIIIDLLHRIAVYYKIDHPDGAGIEMAASKARIISEPGNRETEEVYAIDFL